MQTIVNTQIVNNFLTQGNCLCDWNRRTKSFLRASFDSKKFWLDLARLKSTDTYVNTETRQQVNLYKERRISLGKKNNPSFMLRLGINPKYLFDISCFLEDESKKNNKFVHLNAHQLSKVFDEMRKMVSTNIFFSRPSRYQYVAQSDVKVFGASQELFEIRTRSQSIWIDERSVKKLLMLQPFIKPYMDLLLLEQTKCQEAFIHMLYVYCFEKNCNELISENKLREFLIYSINLQCNCMPYNEFIIEIALNSMETVYECIPTFFNVSMVEELLRQETFKRKGAAFCNMIDTNLAAKSGLYYSDDCGDSLRCCFCLNKIILLACCDNILKLHFQQSPECQFLIDSDNTDNVPISGTNADLKRQFFKTISLIDKDSCFR